MAKELPTWKDTTSYYLNEVNKVPRNYELRLAEHAAIQIHARASQHYARVWRASAVNCTIVQAKTDLKATTDLEAKKEALQLVIKSLEGMLEIAKDNLQLLEP